MQGDKAKKCPSNNCDGNIHVVLDTSDAGDSPTGQRLDLKVWIGGMEMGSDDEPTIWITVNDEKDRHHRVTDGSSDAMFCVSVARMRRICDMVESMHKVGLDQWREELGEDFDG